MKNKGFTLVEVIVVIAILGTIMIIGTSSYIAYYDSLKEKNLENNLEIVYSSAIDYYNNTYKTSFLISDLLKNGYLKANKNDTLIIDDEDYKCYAININNVSETINGKEYTKVKAVLGKNYYNNETKSCDTTDFTNEKYSISPNPNNINSIIITLPQNTQVTLISNLGHYAHFTNDDKESDEINYEFNTEYVGPIIFTATFTEKINDSKSNTIIKSIKIDNKGE